MKFEIKNRWNGSVQFVAEIDCAEDTPLRIKVGLAVKWAYKSGADLSGAVLSGADLSGADLSDADLSGADLRGAVLRGADLSGADLRGADLSGAYLSGADLSGAVLSGADLSGADLSGAVLRGADLSGADLRGADLRQFKSDYWMILTQNRAEIPGLIKALCDGKVDGTTYSGECACLVGTICNVKGGALDDYEKDAYRPAEQWFAAIRPGNKPGDENEGGFRSAKALEWALEYCALTGIEMPDPALSPARSEKEQPQ